MTRPVVYFEILGADGARLRDFYSGVFGWELAPVEPTGGGYHRVHGAGIDGGIGAFPGAPSYVTVYVASDDPAADLARAQEHGAEVVMAPREVTPGITAALFRDPEGHLVGLMKGMGS